MAMRRVEDFRKALLRLNEALSRTREKRESNEYPFFRDSAIQRFEFTVEIFWRTVKEFLEHREGVSCRSPKGCIRELFSLGYLDENETRKLLEMIDSRNMTSHTYHEEIAEAIYKQLREYVPLMEKVLTVVRHEDTST